jgi:hypothetical protein
MGNRSQESESLATVAEKYLCWCCAKPLVLPEGCLVTSQGHGCNHQMVTTCAAYDQKRNRVSLSTAGCLLHVSGTTVPNDVCS